MTIQRAMKRLGVNARSYSEAGETGWQEGRWDSRKPYPGHPPLSEETKRKLRLKSKENWQSGMYDGHGAKVRSAWQRGAYGEETRQKMAANMRTRWAQGDFDGVVHEQRIDGIKEAHQRGAYAGAYSEEANLARAEGMREAWARGDFEERDQRGDKNGEWRGGLSFEPYSPDFNERFKELIRERDDHSCAVCRLSAKSVHHINYIKKDTSPENCITVCRPCHASMNGNREYWQASLTQIMQARTVIEEA